MRKFVYCLFLLLVPSASWAEGELEKFEEHLKAGVQAIEDEDYEAGLYELEMAREYHDHPLLRYHIARAHEALNECTSAKVQYQVVVDDPDSPAEVKNASTKALATLDETCGQKEDAIDSRTANDGSTVRAESSAPPVGRSKSSKSRKIWKGVGWSSIGGGAGIIGLTAVKWLAFDQANVHRWRTHFEVTYGCSLADDNSVDVARCSDPGQARADYETFREQLRKANRSSALGLVTGTVFLAGGVTTLVVLAVTKPRSVEVSILPHPGGIRLFGRF